MAYNGGGFRVSFPSGDKMPSNRERRERTIERISNKNPGDDRRGSAGSQPARSSQPSQRDPARQVAPQPVASRTEPTRNVMFGVETGVKAGVGFSYPGGNAGASWGQQDATVYELEMSSGSLFSSDYQSSEQPLGSAAPGFRRPGLERPQVSASASGRTGFFIGVGTRSGFASGGSRTSFSLSFRRFGFSVAYQSSSDANGETFDGVFVSLGGPSTSAPTFARASTSTTLGNDREVLDLRLDEHIRQWIRNGSGQPWTDALPDH